MKTKLILALATVVLLVGSTSWGVTPAGQCLPPRENKPQRDPGDVFPWGNELPFPWKGIQGTWETQIDGCTSYFSFKAKTAGGVKQLKVTQYDPITCQIVSEGVGFEDNRVVRALMNDKQGYTYRLTIHVFNPADLHDEASSVMFAAKSITVLNMKALGAPERDRTSHELVKVSTDPKAICE